MKARLARPRHLAAAALLALTLMGASTVPAQGGKLYWTNINNAQPLAVGRSDLQGANRNNRFIFVPGNPYGLFVSSQYIYFTNFEWQSSGLGTVGRANLNGTGANQTFIEGASGPADVSVDDDYVYWANSGSNSIGRANLDGTAVNQNFITGNGVRSPATLVADENYLYWTNSQGAPTIGRADLDGTDVRGNFITAGAAGSLPNGLAVSGRYLYWTTFSANTMGRARKDASDVQTAFVPSLSPQPGGPGSVSVDQYLLSVATAGTGTGTVTSNPGGIDCSGGSGDCEEEYPEATTVTLTPTPGDNSTFAGWDGVCSGTGTCTVTMDQAQAVTANFNALPPPPASYPLSVTPVGTGSGTVTSSPAGIDCGSDCVQNFTAGSTVTLRATPADASSFAGWGGACSGTGACTVTMDQARSVTATFSTLPPGSFTLSIDDRGIGRGTVTSSPAGIDCGSDCVQKFAAGSTVRLTAKPAAESTFAGWGGSCAGAGSCSVRMSRARKVYAEFVPTNQFRILWTRAGRSSIATRVRTYDDGRLTQSGTRRGASGRRVRACSGTLGISAPGRATAYCRLTAGARRLARRRAFRVLVQSTFRPAGGSARTLTRSVTVRRSAPGYAG